MISEVLERVVQEAVNTLQRPFPPLWLLLLFQRDPLEPDDVAPPHSPRRLSLPNFAVFG